MITKVTALELGPKQIRVNAVNPTVTMTAMAKVGWSDPAKVLKSLSLHLRNVSLIFPGGPDAGQDPPREVR